MFGFQGVFLGMLRSVPDGFSGMKEGVSGVECERPHLLVQPAQQQPVVLAEVLAGEGAQEGDVVGCRMERGLQPSRIHWFS